MKAGLLIMEPTFQRAQWNGKICLSGMTHVGGMGWVEEDGNLNVDVMMCSSVT